MCLIIDANWIREAFFDPSHPNLSDLHKRLTGSDADPVTLVYGGHLLTEYLRIPPVAAFLKVLTRRGRTKLISSNLVDTEQVIVEAIPSLKSDDPHVLALARVSGVRLLCSNDRDLIEDFTSRQFIEKPRGKVYREIAHAHLLDRYCSRNPSSPRHKSKGSRKLVKRQA